MRCLRKEPERRYQTMLDVSLELQEIKEESDSCRLAAQAPAREAPRRERMIATVTVATVAIAAADYLVWTQVHKPPDLPPQRLAQLTSLNGLESQPALSPDGEQVASECGGEMQDNADIYLKQVGSTELRRLTTDPSGDGMPAWSPDGREIAFLRYRRDGGAVYAVSVITGAERKISDLAQGEYWAGLSWSPDGRWLALGRGTQQQGGGLYLLSAQGGQLRTLTTTKHPASVQYP